MSGGGEADEQQPRLGIAEARQGPRPVALAAVTRRRRRGDGFAMTHEAGAATTAHEARVQIFERGFQSAAIVTR
jgi:hypothetical protein